MTVELIAGEPLVKILQIIDFWIKTEMVILSTKAAPHMYSRTCALAMLSLFA